MRVASSVFSLPAGARKHQPKAKFKSRKAEVGKRKLKLAAKNHKKRKIAGKHFFAAKVLFLFFATLGVLAVKKFPLFDFRFPLFSSALFPALFCGLQFYSASAFRFWPARFSPMPHAQNGYPCSDCASRKPCFAFRSPVSTFRFAFSSPLGVFALNSAFRFPLSAFRFLFQIAASPRKPVSWLALRRPLTGQPASPFVYNSLPASGLCA
jgi:hypothetical protein